MNRPKTPRLLSKAAFPLAALMVIVQAIRQRLTTARARTSWCMSAPRTQSRRMKLQYGRNVLIELGLGRPPGVTFSQRRVRRQRLRHRMFLIGHR